MTKKEREKKKILEKEKVKNGFLEQKEEITTPVVD
jgi:hypothetical protein